MRAFLITFACLTTLAIAQNVVVATPLPSDGGGSQAVLSHTGAERTTSGAPTARAGRVPQASSTFLLLAGLSGLCAVGNRRPERCRPRQA
jgi:hypothetical protein